MGAFASSTVALDDASLNALGGGASEFETVAAASTAVLGGAGAVGDFLSHVIIVPATAAAGAVSFKDGAGTAVVLFAGGATTPLPTLAPIVVALGMRSAAGPWSIITGNNVSVIAIGDFT